MKNNRDAISDYEAKVRKGELGFMEEEEYLNVIEGYLERELYHSALHVSETGLQQYPYSIDIICNKVNALLELNQPHQALEALESATILSPNDMELEFLYAECFLALNHPQDVLYLMQDKLNQCNPEEKSDNYYYQALAYEQKEDISKMYVALTKAIKANTRNEEAYEKLFWAIELGGYYEKSIVFHREILKIDPYSHMAWYNLGHALYCNDEFEAAAEAFEFALAINDKLEFAYRDVADAYMKIGVYDKALAHLQHAELHFEKDSELYAAIGECFEYQQQYVHAGYYYSLALRMDPQNDDIYVRQGSNNLKAENFAAAISSLTKAIDINAFNDEAMALLAKAHLQAGNHDNAIYYCKQALSIAPDTDPYWHLYLTVLFEMELFDSIQEVIEEMPVDIHESIPRMAQVAAFYQSGRSQEALQCLILCKAEGCIDEKLLDVYAPLIKLDPVYTPLLLSNF